MSRIRFVWAAEEAFDTDEATLEEERLGATVPPLSSSSHLQHETATGPGTRAWSSAGTPPLAPATTTTTTTTTRQVVSVEMMLLTAYALAVIAYGVYALASASRTHVLALGKYLIISEPHWPFAWLGSVGRDDGVDRQILAYTHFVPLFAVLSASMGWGVGIIRRHQTGQKTQQQQPLSRRCGTGTTHSKEEDSGCMRLVHRLLSQPWALSAFHVIVGGVACTIIHGPHVFIPFTIMLANFWFFSFLQRQRWCPYWLFMTIMWTTHVALLYASYYFEGFERVYWLQRLLPSNEHVSEAVLGHPRQPLWPCYMRWFIAYRMYVLRMIAFNYDMWEAHRLAAVARERAISKHARGCVDCARLREQEKAATRGVTCVPGPSTAVVGEMWVEEDVAAKSGVATASAGADDDGGEVCVVEGVDDDDERGRAGHVDDHVMMDLNTTPAAAGQHQDGVAGYWECCWCYKLRADYPRETAEYSLVNYAAYMLYHPTYLAGPISSFNAFASHLAAPSRVMSRSAAWVYVGRIAAAYICLELMLHYLFLNAFAERVVILREMSLAVQGYFLYFYLAYIYLKFNFMWKASRLFSLWCGVEVPENLPQCFSNACFTRDFWRHWHASFNLWIVRYMYIPMGGRRRVLQSVVPIFVFIAMWHDHTLNLLKWAALIILVFAAEVLVGDAYGVLRRRFEKEMLHAVNSNSSRNSNDDGAGDTVIAPGDRLAPPHQTDGRQGSRRCRPLRAVARFAAVSMTRPQRAYTQRVITACGGTVAVAVQIAANIIGYAMEPEKVEDAPRRTPAPTHSPVGSFVAAAKADPLLCVLAGMFLYTIATCGTISKAKKALAVRKAKRQYGLQ